MWAVEPLPTSIKEKETHSQRAVSLLQQGKGGIVRFWRVTSLPLLQTNLVLKTLRAIGSFTLREIRRC